ncbi:MAG: hypothetical protein LBS69_03665 [Prevotellaceae bacterium]|jgi:hypothetical protein|nr:hypothetical protein [Prevotellaceae bacterium]
MENKITQYKWVDNMGTNPASVDLDTGIVQLNRQTWGSYSKFQQKFIIKHEEGHLNNPYGSEYDADRYALNKMAGTESRSLAKSVHALESIPGVTESRVEKMYVEALKLDASMGNKIAEKELLKIKNMNGKRIKRATGTEAETILKNRGNSHKTNGFVMGNYYFSFTNLFLMVIIILMLRRKNS